MGDMAQEEMSKTPNSESVREQSAQLSPSNLQLSGDASTSNIKNRTSYILRRIVDLIVAGVFIYAGAIKALDPVQFANDIDTTRFFHGQSVSHWLFICRGWRFSAASRWLYVCCIVGRYRS